MLIKELGIDPDGVSKNNDNYNMHGVNDKLIINQHTEYFPNHFKGKPLSGNPTKWPNTQKIRRRTNCRRTV